MDEFTLVPFHGDALEAMEREGDVWVSLRRLCDTLGIAFDAQRVKLKEKEWATITTIVTVAEDGKQREVTAINLDTLSGWLFSIDASRVADGAREKVVRYQRECARVLRNHFFGHRPPKTQAEVLLDAARLLVEHQQLLANHGGRLSSVEARQALAEARAAEAEKELLALPPPDCQAAAKTARARLNEAVRMYCHAAGMGHQEAWNKLYREALYRLQIDLKARARNAGTRPIEAAEAAGILPDLYAIAVDVFRLPLAAG